MMPVLFAAKVLARDMRLGWDWGGVVGPGVVTSTVMV